MEHFIFCTIWSQLTSSSTFSLHIDFERGKSKCILSYIYLSVFSVVTSNSQQLLENPSKIKEFHVSPWCIYICLSLKLVCGCFQKQEVNPLASVPFMILSLLQEDTNILQTTTKNLMSFEFLRYQTRKETEEISNQKKKELTSMGHLQQASSHHPYLHK